MSMVVKETDGKSKSSGVKNRRGKPDWDSSVNDLSEFRATPEEIARRQEAHRSRNLELVRKSTIEKRIASARRQALADSTNRPHTGNAFLREILYSNGEANQLLDDTSKALQVAHDIFRDDARKYKAVPAITSINSDDEENAFYSRPMIPDGLIKSSNESQTKLEKLSDSVMKKRALNETFSASSDSNHSASSSDEDSGCKVGQSSKQYETTPPMSYPTRLDLQRFQNLLEQEDLSTIASESSAPLMAEKAGSALKPAEKAGGTLKPHTSPVKVEKNKATENRGVGKAQSPVTHPCQKEQQRKKIPNKRAKSLSYIEPTDLQSLLKSLEEELRKYEIQYTIEGGECRETHSPIPAAAPANSGVSTFTVTLITALRRMMGYFNKVQGTLSEERRQRGIKEQQLLDLTNRTDLLTKELIETQEQFHVVLDELNRVKTEQRQEIDTMKATLVRLSRGETVHTVTVAKPQQTRIAGPQSITSPVMTLRRSRSPALVTTYKEFEGSSEQQKLLRSSGNMNRENIQRVADQPITEQVTAEANRDQQVSGAGNDMSLEQRIEQLRGDHQETLERFRKLGLELQKGNPGGTPGPSWLGCDL